MLLAIRCQPSEKRATLPTTHNWAVNQALRDLRTQVEECQAQTAEAPTRRRGQAYVVNQLHALLRGSKEPTERETIIALERALKFGIFTAAGSHRVESLSQEQGSGRGLTGEAR